MAAAPYVLLCLISYVLLFMCQVVVETDCDIKVFKVIIEELNY